MRKNALKTLSRQINSPIIPKPARFEFKIQGTKIIENKEESKELAERTEKKVSEIRKYLKYEIICCQKIEIKEYKSLLLKTFIHNVLLFGNQLVRLLKLPI